LENLESFKKILDPYKTLLFKNINEYINTKRLTQFKNDIKEILNKSCKFISFYINEDQNKCLIEENIDNINIDEYKKIIKRLKAFYQSDKYQFNYSKYINLLNDLFKLTNIYGEFIIDYNKYLEKCYNIDSEECKILKNDIEQNFSTLSNIINDMIDHVNKIE
jgi:hypothetical protein